MRNDNIKLKSGKIISPNRNFLGITRAFNYDTRKFDGEWEISEGYDNELWLEEYDNNDKYIPVFTQSELIEIADIMIERWNEFKRDVLFRVEKRAIPDLTLRDKK